MLIILNPKLNPPSPNGFIVMLNKRRERLESYEETLKKHSAHQHHLKSALEKEKNHSKIVLPISIP